MVATHWGIYAWKEFKGAPKGVPALLTGMLITYVAGLVLIVLAH